MSTIRVINQVILYDDVTFINDSTESRINYKIDVQVPLTADFRLDQKFPATAITPITLYNGPYKWFYLNCDQPLSVRFNGNVDDTCLVSPDVNGNMTGLLLKRGNIVSLSINVQGATSPRVIILAGAI